MRPSTPAPPPPPPHPHHTPLSSEPSPGPPLTPTVSPTSVCPYSCIDEFTVGAFKGGFAGSLWGVYAFRQRWRQRATDPTALSSLPLRSSSPVAAVLLSPRLRALSPLLIYPVKFAALVSLYRMLSCCGCYLSFPSPPSPLLVPAISASLAGFVVSLPHLDARHSLRTTAASGLLGGLAGLGQLGLQSWQRHKATRQRDAGRLVVTQR